MAMFAPMIAGSMMGGGGGIGSMMGGGSPPQTTSSTADNHSTVNVIVGGQGGGEIDAARIMQELNRAPSTNGGTQYAPYSQYGGGIQPLSFAQATASVNAQNGTPTPSDIFKGGGGGGYLLLIAGGVLLWVLLKKK